MSKRYGKSRRMFGIQGGEVEDRFTERMHVVLGTPIYVALAEKVNGNAQSKVDKAPELGKPAERSPQNIA
jgi:hypothetical protein